MVATRMRKANNNLDFAVICHCEGARIGPLPGLETDYGMKIDIMYPCCPSGSLILSVVLYLDRMGMSIRWLRLAHSILCPENMEAMNI
jgi:hypothetical protein